MKRQVYLVGIGPGSEELRTPQASEAIRQSAVLLGSKRALAAVAGEQERCAVYLPEDVRAYLDSHPEAASAAVLLTGDTGFYSGAKKLCAALSDYEVTLVCGISSVQVFCAKLGLGWDEVKLLSLHGRRQNLLQAVRLHRKVLALTGGEHTVSAICRLLCGAGLSAVRVTVGERLSYPEERLCTGTAGELAGQEFDPLSVVLFENEHPTGGGLGIPDEAFVRGKVPMTKAEVRAVCVSKLRICPEDVVYDIGAGTGSVSVEAAILAEQGAVYAVERNPEAAVLIRENAVQFGCENLHVVEGLAPLMLAELPPPDRAFIGGSAGNLKEILCVLRRKNPRVRVVLSAIALQTLGTALGALKEAGFSDPEVALVSVAKDKQAGGYTMMMGQNPVYVLAADATEDS